MIKIERFSVNPKSVLALSSTAVEDVYESVAAHVYDRTPDRVLWSQRETVKRAVLRAAYAGRIMRVFKINVFGLRVWTSIWDI